MIDEKQRWIAAFQPEQPVDKSADCLMTRNMNSGWHSKYYCGKRDVLNGSLLEIYLFGWRRAARLRRVAMAVPRLLQPALGTQQRKALTTNMRSRI